MKVLSRHTFIPGPGGADVTFMLELSEDEAKALLLWALEKIDRGGGVEDMRKALDIAEKMAAALRATDFGA